MSSIQRSLIFNYTSGKKRGSENFVSDKVNEKLYPRIIIVSGYKRHFPQELAILSKSATQYNMSFNHLRRMLSKISF